MWILPLYTRIRLPNNCILHKLWDVPIYPHVVRLVCADDTLQRMANSIFTALNSKGVFLVYLDDVLIHTTTCNDIPCALKQKYLQFYHDHPFSGHLGFHKVLGKLCLRYYWFNLQHSISTYIKQCALYQHIKPAGKPAGMLQPITVELIGWDFMGPFLETPRGNKYILVITKYH